MNTETVILLVIAGIAVLAVLAKLFYKLLAAKIGDCALQWADGYLKIESAEIRSDWEALITFAIPLKSIGKQQCILVDMFGRVHPEGDKYCSIDNCVYIYPGGNRRRDRYFEATIIKPKDTLIIRGEMTLSSQDIPIKTVLAELKDIRIDLYYKYYNRNFIQHERKILTLDILPALGGIEPVEKADQYATIDKGQDALPIRTPLLGSNDNVYSVFETYAKKHVKEGDVFAICESALAIMEGRAYYVEDIKPGFMATHLNKIFKMDSSLSSPFSLEMAIREVGAPKIIFSFIMGILGKLIGRAGDFYYFAGRAVATIDDCTGTLPPFDKYVVMGPANPKKSAKEFKKHTGVDMAVVDVNDLGKVDVLALTDPAAKPRVVEALKTNPQGNANEQTPIALIRKKNI